MGGSGIELIRFKDGLSCVVKSGPHAHTEGKMLKDLGEHLPCAEVYVLDDTFFAMEYIEDSSTLDESDVADSLARLHLIETPHFGYPYDTTIGSFTQPNSSSCNWAEFFRDQRIYYQAHACLDAGQISLTQFRKLELLCNKMHDMLPAHPKPCLIHGDIWDGNVLAKAGRPIFIDPAIYWAHHECELGFIKMLHTFGRRFYDHYQALHPIEPGFFGEREHIYMLYWVLVHVRAFGSGYVGSMENILNQFV